MVGERIFRSLISRFLRAFIDRLEDVGIEWISVGHFNIRRLAFCQFSILQCVDIRSLYIHKISVDCSWNFLWKKDAFLIIEIDTVLGLATSYSARYQPLPDTTVWCVGPLLALLSEKNLLVQPPSERDFHHHQGGSLKKTQQPSLFQRGTQWLSGFVLKSANQVISVAALGASSLATFGKNRIGLTNVFPGLFDALRRIRITVKNVHFRYEDKVSSPGHPFQIGCSVERLHLAGSRVNSSTTDDEKIVCPGVKWDTELFNVALYHNCDHFEGISATDLDVGSAAFRKHFLKRLGRASDLYEKNSYILSPTSISLHIALLANDEKQVPLSIMNDSLISLSLCCWLSSPSLRTTLTHSQIKDQLLLVFSLLGIMEKNSSNRESIHQSTSFFHEISDLAHYRISSMEVKLDVEIVSFCIKRPNFSFSLMLSTSSMKLEGVRFHGGVVESKPFCFVLHKIETSIRLIYLEDDGADIVAFCHPSSKEFKNLNFMSSKYDKQTSGEQTSFSADEESLKTAVTEQNFNQFEACLNSEADMSDAIEEDNFSDVSTLNCEVGPVYNLKFYGSQIPNPKDVCLCISVDDDNIDLLDNFKIPLQPSEQVRGAATLNFQAAPATIWIQNLSAVIGEAVSFYRYMNTNQTYFELIELLPIIVRRLSSSLKRSEMPKKGGLQEGDHHFSSPTDDSLDNKILLPSIAKARINLLGVYLYILNEADSCLDNTATSASPPTQNNACLSNLAATLPSNVKCPDDDSIHSPLTSLHLAHGLSFSFSQVEATLSPYCQQLHGDSKAFCVPLYRRSTLQVTDISISSLVFNGQMHEVERAVWKRCFGPLTISSEFLGLLSRNDQKVEGESLACLNVSPCSVSLITDLLLVYQCFANTLRRCLMSTTSPVLKASTCCVSKYFLQLLGVSTKTKEPSDHQLNSALTEFQADSLTMHEKEIKKQGDDSSKSLRCEDKETDRITWESSQSDDDFFYEAVDLRDVIVADLLKQSAQFEKRESAIKANLPRDLFNFFQVKESNNLTDHIQCFSLQIKKILKFFLFQFSNEIQLDVESLFTFGFLLKISFQQFFLFVSPTLTSAEEECLVNHGLIIDLQNTTMIFRSAINQELDIKGNVAVSFGSIEVKSIGCSSQVASPSLDLYKDEINCQQHLSVIEQLSWTSSGYAAVPEFYLNTSLTLISTQNPEARKPPTVFWKLPKLSGMTSEFDVLFERFNFTSGECPVSQSILNTLIEKLDVPKTNGQIDEYFKTAEVQTGLKIAKSRINSSAFSTTVLHFWLTKHQRHHHSETPKKEESHLILKIHSWSGRVSYLIGVDEILLQITQAVKVGEWITKTMQFQTSRPPDLKQPDESNEQLQKVIHDNSKMDPSNFATNAEMFDSFEKLNDGELLQGSLFVFLAMDLTLEKGTFVGATLQPLQTYKTSRESKLDSSKFEFLIDHEHLPFKVPSSYLRKTIGDVLFSVPVEGSRFICAVDLQFLEDCNLFWSTSAACNKQDTSVDKYNPSSLPNNSLRPYKMNSTFVATPSQLPAIFEINKVYAQLMVEEASVESYLPQFQETHAESFDANYPHPHHTIAEIFPIFQMSPLRPPATQSLRISLISISTLDANSPQNAAMAPQWDLLSNTIRPSKFLKAFLFSMIGSNISLHLHYDFFLHFGHWLFESSVRIQKAVEFFGAMRQTQAEPATIHVKAKLLPLLIQRALILQSVISNISLFASTDGASWVGTDIQKLSASYPAVSLDDDSPNFVEQHDPSARGFLRMTHLVEDDKFIHNALSILEKGHNERKVGLRIINVSLKSFLSPLNCRSHLLGENQAETYLQIGYINQLTTELQENCWFDAEGVFASGPTFAFLLVIGMLCGDQSRQKNNIAAASALDMKDVVPGSLLVLSPTASSHLLHFVSELLNTSVAFLQSILQTRSSKASKQLKRNVKKLIGKSKFPPVTFQLKLIRPVIQITSNKGIDDSAAISLLCEHLTVLMDFKAGVSTRFSTKIWQMRAFVSTHDGEDSEKTPKKMMQVCCLSSQTHPTNIASILCQPFTFLRERGNLEGLWLQSKDLKYCTLTDIDVLADEEIDPENDLLLLEFSSHVSQLKRSIMLRLQLSHAQFVLFPDLLTSGLTIMKQLRIEFNTYYSKFAIRRRQFAALSSTLSGLSSIHDFDLSETVSQGYDTPRTIGQPSPDITTGTLESFPVSRFDRAPSVCYSTSEARNLPHKVSGTALPRNVITVPRFGGTRDRLQHPISAIDPPRPLGFTVTICIETFSFWAIAKAQPSKLSTSRSFEKPVFQGCLDTFRDVIGFSSQVNCKVHSEDLRIEDFFHIRWSLPGGESANLLHSLEARFISPSLPSVRLDLELTRSVFLAGELKESDQEGARHRLLQLVWDDNEKKIDKREVCYSSNIMQEISTCVESQPEISLSVISVPPLSSLMTAAFTTISTPLQYLCQPPFSSKPLQGDGKESQNTLAASQFQMSSPNEVESVIRYNSINSSDPPNEQNQFSRRSSRHMDGTCISNHPPSSCTLLSIFCNSMSDYSVRSLLETPIDVSFICSSRPRTGQGEKRHGEIKLDTCCSAILAQICRPDLRLFDSIIRNFQNYLTISSPSLDRTASLSTAAVGPARLSPCDLSLGHENFALNTIHRTFVDSVPLVEDELLSTWSSEIDSDATPIYSSAKSWFLIWKVSSELDGLQVTMMSWPYLMPLTRFKVGVVGMQVSRKALSAGNTTINVQIADVSFLLGEPFYRSLRRDSPKEGSGSPQDIASVSAESTYPRQFRPNPYFYCDPSTNCCNNYRLVPATEPFTLDIIANPLQLSLDVAVNSSFRILVASSFLPMLKIIGVEFDVKELQNGPGPFRSPPEEITLLATPITALPISFQSLFRPTTSSWFLPQASTGLRADAASSVSGYISNGIWNVSRHQSGGTLGANEMHSQSQGHRAEAAEATAALFHQTSTNIASVPFLMPLSLADHRRVGLAASRWMSSIRQQAHACEGNEQYSDREILPEDDAKYGLMVHDLRQIPFFLVSSQRESTYWIRNESCHDIIFRIDGLFQQSGQIKSGAQVLLKDFSASATLLLHVPELPTANRQVQIHMLRYLPTSSPDRDRQLVLQEEAGEGRRSLVIGCPLRIRSDLACPVEILFLAEANANSDWQCELPPQKRISIPLNVSAHCTSLIVKLRSEAGPVWTASCGFRDLEHRCAILTASVSAQRTFVCGLRSISNNHGQVTELLLFEPIVLKNGLPRSVEIAVSQGFPHRETVRTLSPLSSTGLTLFDWNLSLAVRLRIPSLHEVPLKGVAALGQGRPTSQSWSSPATAALPPEMLASYNGFSLAHDLFDESTPFQAANPADSVSFMQTKMPSDSCDSDRDACLSVSLKKSPLINDSSAMRHNMPTTWGLVSNLRRLPSQNQNISRQNEKHQKSQIENDLFDEGYLYVLNRSVMCTMPNENVLEVNVRFEFDGFRLGISVTCPYWILNLTSLRLCYIPSALSSSGAASLNTLDNIELPACRSFDEPLDSETFDVVKGEGLAETIAFNPLYCELFRFSFAKSRLQHQKIKRRETYLESLPQLTSQCHDGFRIESPEYGLSPRCDLSVSRSTLGTEGLSKEILERSSLVSLTKASVPIVQQVIRYTNKICSAVIIVFRPAHVIVNRCPFSIHVRRTPIESSVELPANMSHHLIWKHHRGAKHIYIARVCADDMGVPILSEAIYVSEGIDGFLNLYISCKNKASQQGLLQTSLSEVEINRISDSETRLTTVHVQTYDERGTRFIFVSSPYFSSQSLSSWPLQQQPKPRLPPPPCLIRNCLLVPIYVKLKDSKVSCIEIPSFTEIVLGPESLSQPCLSLSVFVDQSHRLLRTDKKSELEMLPDDVNGANKRLFYKLSPIRSDKKLFVFDIKATEFTSRWSVMHFNLLEDEGSSMSVSRPGAVIKESESMANNNFEKQKQLSRVPSSGANLERAFRELSHPSDSESSVSEECANSERKRVHDVASVCQNESTTKSVNDRPPTSMHYIGVRQHLMRYICHVVVTSVGATSIVTIDGSHVTSSSLNAISCSHTTKMDCSAEIISYEKSRLFRVDDDILDFSKSVLSCFAFPLFSSMRFSPTFAFDASHSQLTPAQICSLASQRAMTTSTPLHWLSRIELTVHLRQILLSFVTSIRSMQRLEESSLRLQQAQISSMHNRLKESEITLPHQQTSASRVKDFIERGTLSGKNFSAISPDVTEVRRLGVAPLEVVITQFGLWTRPRPQDPLREGYILERESARASGGRASASESLGSQRRLQMAILSIDVMGSNQRGNLKYEEGKEDEKKVPLDSLHILRPTKGVLFKDLDYASSEPKDLKSRHLLQSQIFEARGPSEKQIDANSSSRRGPWTEKALPAVTSQRKLDQPLAWSDTHVFQLLIDFDIPWIPDKDSIATYVLLPNDRGIDKLYLLNGSTLIETMLPVPLNDSRYWVPSFHLHHFIASISSLTVRLDFSWADQCLKPLVLAFQACAEELLPGNSSIPSLNSRNVAIIVPTAALKVPARPPLFPRVLLGSFFLQELRFNLTIYRLLKVMTFNEAEFRWPAVRIDEPQIVTAVVLQRSIHEQFVHQLLRQWFQIILAFDIVGRPLSRMRKFWNQLVRRLLFASIDLPDPNFYAPRSFSSWWEIPASPSESLGLQKFAILVLYSLSRHLHRFADQSSTPPPPPPIAALLADMQRSKPPTPKAQTKRNRQLQ